MRDVNPPGVGGRFINISSIGGYTAQATLSIYNGAKFGMLLPSAKIFCADWCLRQLLRD